MASAPYRDASDRRNAGTALQPNWIPSLAVPFGVGVATYVLASTPFQSANPSEDAVYAYMVARWPTGLLYPYRGHVQTRPEA